MIKKIVKCEVCNTDKLFNVLDLGMHPLCDDLIKFDEKRVCKEYPIQILFCKKCLTAHQKYQVPKAELFHKDYHYRARMTKSVLSGMEDFVENCEKQIGCLKGFKVLDIGCNDGSLLDFFKKKGALTFGVEPTKAALESSHYTINKFFDRNVVNTILEKIGKPDLITFTNVFAHIENLSSLIDNLKSITTQETYIMIENHYLGAIFKNSQFDTFYHEHPRTYSVRSFNFIARSLGLNLLNYQFVSRYGGNVRVFIGKGKTASAVSKDENFFDKFKVMQSDLENWKEKTINSIRELNNKFGPLNAKAFPGRAAILIKLLDLNENNIKAVYEITGSKKVFHYVPGTKIPILPEQELFKKKSNTTILNLAWHIPDEVKENLKKNGFEGEIFNIKDFN